MASENAHQIAVQLLREKLDRIEAAGNRVSFLAVNIETLESLLDDHRDLRQLLEAHPELRQEVPYA